MKKKQQFTVFLCLFLMLFTFCIHLEAATESVNEISHDLDENNMCKMCGSECFVYHDGKVIVVVPKKTNITTVYARVKNNEGKTITYQISDQDKKKFDKNDEYIKLHGCAISCLTSVLNAKVPLLSGSTPDQIIASVERKVLGVSLFEKNYSRPVEKQMPITLYGMTKVFEEYGINHKYVYDFNTSTAVKEIAHNLQKGNPVIICVRSSPDKKWTEYAHIMLLIGLTDDGRAIICDSMNRSWSATDQRIKYEKVDELVKYMKSTKKKPTDLYWSTGSGKDGYILVY